MSVNQINIEAVNKRTRERKHTNLWNEVYKGKKPTNDTTLIIAALSAMFALCFIVYVVVSLIEAYQVIQ